jgi:hypothetical protein
MMMTNQSWLLVLVFIEIPISPANNAWMGHRRKPPRPSFPFPRGGGIAPFRFNKTLPRIDHWKVEPHRRAFGHQTT